MGYFHIKTMSTPPDNSSRFQKLVDDQQKLINDLSSHNAKLLKLVEDYKEMAEKLVKTIEGNPKP